jgi:hypothetical protein
MVYTMKQRRPKEFQADILTNHHMQKLKMLYATFQCYIQYIVKEISKWLISSDVQYSVTPTM